MTTPPVPATADAERLAALGTISTVFTWSGTVDARLEYANDAWLAFRGRTLEQELGQGWLEGVHPEDLDAVVAMVGQAYAELAPFEHEYRVRDREGRYRWILDRGEPRFAPDGTFLGFHGTSLEIDARVHAQRAAGLLSEVGRLVASEDDPADALEEVARAAIPTLGDACVIDVLDDGSPGGFRRAVLAHRDPELERIARSLAPPQAHSPLHRVLEAGRTVLVHHSPEEFADAGAPEDRDVRLRRPLRSSILAPIAARGRAFGVMTFGSHDAEFHDEARDLPLAEEVARRVGLALDHAQSLREARLAQRASDTARSALAAAYSRSRLLADVSGVLESSLQLDPVLDQVAELLTSWLADAAVIDVVDHHGRRCRLGVSAADDALLAVFDDGGAVPEPEPVVREIELQRSGRDQGMLRLAWAAGGGPDPEDAPLIEELARRIALAVDAALLYAERSTAARTLQGSLLPDELPLVPGVAISARYLPAAGGVVAGDFYDVFPLPDGSWVFVVGDVCGKGVEAAALTAQTRYTLRALAPWLLSPRRLLEETNTALRRQRDDERFVTLAVARLHPPYAADAPSRRLEVAAAGHPAPFVLRADGAADVVACHGTVLGIVDRPELVPASTDLYPGDVLALFTDGITEARRTAIFDSATLGAAVASSRAGGPHGVALALERLARRHAEGLLRDDIAILTVAPDPV